MSASLAPLVPADVDLSKLDGFMLDTVRLLGSELLALSTGDEFKAAVILWCRAWKQRPACSLPDDDRILASFAMLSMAKWRKVKVMALRGFVKCSDGRLYHKVLAGDAMRAHKAAEQRRAAIRKRWGKEDGDDTKRTTGPPTRPSTGGHSEPIRPYYETDTIDGTGRDESRIPTDDPGAARDQAGFVVREFLSMRSGLWPRDPSLPSNASTLREQAKNYLAQGATPELCIAIFGRVMRQKIEKGEGPPTHLGFCKLSLRDAIAKAADQPDTALPATDFTIALERWTNLPSYERDKTPMPRPEDFRAKKAS